jgi:small-conductance mechanosensitive channel
MPNEMLVTGLCVQIGHVGRIIEGIIMDIGWYRTLIHSFEREAYIVPNSVFSRTVVLNVTRKVKEWRVFESVGVHVEDISAVPMIIGDMRRIFRDDVRVLPKLHRRVLLDKVNRNELTIYIPWLQSRRPFWNLQWHVSSMVHSLLRIAIRYVAACQQESEFQHPNFNCEVLCHTVLLPLTVIALQRCVGDNSPAV